MKTDNPSDTRPAPAAAARPKKFGVLVIDDSPVDREISARHLGKAWPFEHDLVIDFAADGREALDKMRDRRFAMIVLDWKLPGMGGGEVLRHIRKSGVHIPVIVLSGLERAGIDEDLDALGAAFLNKDQMDPVTFHKAIGQSLQLLGLQRPAEV